jgi:hypothetical protein
MLQPIAQKLDEVGLRRCSNRRPQRRPRGPKRAFSARNGLSINYYFQVITFFY